MQEMLAEYLPILIFLGLAIGLGLILIIAAAIVTAMVAPTVMFPIPMDSVAPRSGIPFATLYSSRPCKPAAA